MHISVIIPAKNESENLRNLFKRIKTSCEDNNIQYSIIFINDGSTDNTVNVLNMICKQYPLKIITHSISEGKANSIIQGIELSSTEYVVMIDADLQYPPEAIPEMARLATEYPVVVARRNTNHEKLHRKILSTIHRFLYGYVLFGLTCDIQSGLKLFPKKLLNHIDRSNITPWTLDLSILYTAKQLGYKIGETPIIFSQRSGGISKVSILQSIVEHTYTAIRLRFFNKKRSNL